MRCSSSTAISDWRAQIDAFLFGALRCQALQFELRDAEAFADASHLGIKLLQHVARRHGLMLGFALFAVEAFEQGS